jgi:hypothetical protein
MVAFSFSIDYMRTMIRTGQKQQTTRPLSIRRFQQCMVAVTHPEKYRLQLYWKQRTKECALLLETNVKACFLVKFTYKADRLGLQLEIPLRIARGSNPPGGVCECTISGFCGSIYFKTCSLTEMETFAKADGFVDAQEMFTWFMNHYQERLFETVFYTVQWCYPAPQLVESTKKLLTYFSQHPNTPQITQWSTCLACHQKLPADATVCSCGSTALALNESLQGVKQC